MDYIRFETAIKCLGLKPDDLDDYEKMEELIETAEENVRRIRRKSERTLDRGNKKFLGVNKKRRVYYVHHGGTC